MSATNNSPRFIWNIGSIAEELPDMPDQPADDSLVLWDRKHKAAAVVVSPAYAQALCLESANGQPFTALANWLNGLPSDVLRSEGLPE